MLHMSERSEVEELVDEILRDTEGRFVLIGTPEGAAAGRAFVFDTTGRCWIRFSSIGPDDGANKNSQVVQQMLLAGAKVLLHPPTADKP